jgi:heptose-I-phosphate ethanolaminephosphotransferase
VYSLIKANKLLRFLGLAILAYLVIFGIYALTSVNVINKAFYLQMRRFIPCAIAIAASSFLWLNANLASKKLFPHLLLGFAWILSFNLFYWFTFHKTENHFDNYTDIVFGSYLIAATICLRLLLLTINTNTLLHKFQAVVMAFLETMFFIIPAFQIYYYLTYHTSFSVNAAIAILQTNPAEAREFILLNLGYFGLFVFGLVCLCFFFCYFRLNLINDKIKLSSKLLLLITIIFMSTAYYSTHILRETGVLFRTLRPI